MSAVPGLRGLVSWIDDRANPIVIKELRQAVQSRFIVTTLILLLILLLTTLMLYVMNTEDIGDNELPSSVGTVDVGDDVVSIAAGNRQK